ncbi:DUF3231 family protein [Virgibacillus oceani]
MTTNKDHIELTAGEISSLWTSYQSDTSAICGIKHFLIHVEDEQIRDILQETLTLMEEHIQAITDFFKKEGHPVPQGFTSQDVDLSAPRLFSDKLYLEYILNMTNIELVIYSNALIAAVRKDVIDYYSEVLTATKDLHMKSKKLSIEKGIYIREPHIPKPTQIDFIKKQSFLAGWFADRRPLLGAEITNLVFHARRNALGHAVMTGFSQVAKTKEVRRYFERGLNISGKHLEIFGTILSEENLANGTQLMTSDVTNSTTSPFSEKLMMTFTITLIASAIGQYGVAAAVSPRRDLGAHYSRLILEVTNYADDGANILIDHGWMEQPPMAPDRNDLAK